MAESSGKVNSFDVLKAMSAAGKDIRLAPLSNVLRAQKCKAGTQITIGVEGDVIGAIAQGRFVGGLILTDKDQYRQTEEELRGE